MSRTRNFEKNLDQADTVQAARALFSEASRELGYQWFDAVAMTAALMPDPRRAGRYFVSNYFTGDAWAYFPAEWPVDDEIAALTARSSAPIDYLSALAECDATATITFQKALLKTFGVRRAWLFPHSTLGEYRAVTCYMTRKREGIDEVFQSTRNLLYGLSAQLIDKLDALHRDEAERKPAPIIVNKMPIGLTAQEIACFRLLAKGRSNAEIGAELDLSVNTVKSHLKKVFRKLGVRSRTEAAALALHHSLI